MSIKYLIGNRLILKKLCSPRTNNRIGKKTVVSAGTILEGKNIVGDNCSLSETRMGRMSYMGNNCILDYCVIGRYCSIGDRCIVISGNHPVDECISSHPCFFSKMYSFSYVSQQKFKEHTYANETSHIKCIIDNDVWIGSDARIMSGVHIGNGAIVGAGALVTKDVPPYSVVAGVPARKLRNRFSDVTIDYLLKCKWWDLEEDQLREYSDSFMQVNQWEKK